MTNCKNCGAALKQDIAICKYCGSDYRVSSNTSSASIINDAVVEDSYLNEEVDIEDYYSDSDTTILPVKNRKPNLLDLYKSNFKYGPISWCLWGVIRASLPAFFDAVPQIDAAYNDGLFFSHIGTPLYFFGAFIFVFIVPLLFSIINYFFYGEEFTETVRFFQKTLLVSFSVWVALYFCRFFFPDGRNNLSEHNFLLLSPTGGVFWWIRCFLFLAVLPTVATVIFYKRNFPK